MNYYDNNKTIDTKKRQFLELTDSDGKLKKLIQEIIDLLNKYEWFSLNYKIESSDNIELNKIIEKEYEHFNEEFPWFLKDAQDMINFFRYQRSILLSDTIHEIQNKFWGEIEYTIWTLSIEWFKHFFQTKKNYSFIDESWKIVSIRKLFTDQDYYLKNYEKVIWQYWIQLPANPIEFFWLSREKIREELWLTVTEKSNNLQKKLNFNVFLLFFNQHYKENFIDSEWNSAPIFKLFSNFSYYSKNYKIIEKKYWIYLPPNPSKYYNMTLYEIVKRILYSSINTNYQIWIKTEKNSKDNVRMKKESVYGHIDNKNFTNINDFSHFFEKHKNELFIDSEWNEVLIVKLFSDFAYYIRNYRKVWEKYWISLPENPTSYFNTSRKNIVSNIVFGIIKSKWLFSSFWDFKEFCNYPWNLTALKNVENFGYLNWVYCDIDWTLIANESVVNEKVIKFLVKKHEEWYKITLWTAWDTKKKIKLLEKNMDALSKAWLTIELMKEMWIISEDGTRKIENKYNHKNDIVEIVVDDRNAKRFMYQVWIIPKIFLNVNSL